MNVRKLIELLNQAAERLPDGLDSEVVMHLCNGFDEPGVVTKMLGLAHGEDGDGRYARSVIIQGHPHDDDEQTVQRPAAMGVDAELERLVAGEVRKRPGMTVVLNDEGDGLRIPYGEGGRPMMPGSPEAVAAGCICDPEKNDHGRGARSDDAQHIDMVTNNACELHRRVKIDPKDVPPDDE